MTEPNILPADSAPPAPRRRGPLARLGCLIGLVLWFLLILSPCLLVFFATQGEITLNLGSAPGQTARIWLVMEARERGLGVSLPSVYAASETALCMQTDVRYYLWQGQADSLSYCECYQRESTAAPWSFVSTAQGACDAPEGPS